MTTTQKHTDFSFEVLPPLRGKGLTSVYNTIDRLMPYNPVCVNITTHRAETVYNELPNGTYQKLSVRNRPGTVSIAAAIQERYNIRTVPHIICSGFSASEIESELVDLSYLGITDLLLLRGDRAKGLRSEGITIPIIPGIKPLTTLNHCTMLPRTFHIDFPQELANEFEKCSSNDDVKALGVEWGIQQVRELKEAGVPIVHFYTMNAAYSTELIIKQTL